jgi:ABC-2 type transport system permease protein
MRLADLVTKYKKHQFLFEELVKRDFKKKYKRTSLGMLWSLLSPLLTLMIMKIVFTQFFGRNTLHYTTYLFAGNLIFSYFSTATTQGMTSLYANASSFTKVNIPKYLFVFSSNISSLINFLLTLVLFFIFAAIDNITFGWHFFALLYPVIMLVALTIGVSLILSALYVFFRDMQYLYGVFTLLLMYTSAIFYQVDAFSEKAQRLFLLNPVYDIIKYVRLIVIDGTIPSFQFHLIIFAAGVVPLIIGMAMYRKYNHRFLYYV